MIEIRGFGDGRTIVLHTTDNLVYQELRDLSKLKKELPYHQWLGERKILVGVDLYFPKSYQTVLEHKINKLGFQWLNT